VCWTKLKRSLLALFEHGEKDGLFKERTYENSKTTSRQQTLLIE
jgi:hypothetical protein